MTISLHDKSNYTQHIPKVIHYCWFGHGEKNDVIKKCMATWKVYCPDYEIIEWNEDNFDIHSNKFVEQAYSVKKWAFVSDYVRQYVLYHYGGIYLDTDMEIVKPIDRFLYHRAFSGFQGLTPRLPTAIEGAEKEHPWMKAFLSYYDDKQFINDDGSYNDEPNTYYMTEVTKKMYGVKLDDTYQELDDDVYIYPHDFFCPEWNGICVITDDTYTIHHFTGTWWDKNHDKDVAIREKINSSKIARALSKSSIGKKSLKIIPHIPHIPEYIKKIKTEHIGAKRIIKTIHNILTTKEWRG